MRSGIWTPTLTDFPVRARGTAAPILGNECQNCEGCLTLWLPAGIQPFSQTCIATVEPTPSIIQ
jgi:hypothetical protein